MMIEVILICLAAYLIGSVPFGLLLTKAAGLGDIRQIGSGNIGATNVLRTGRKGLAALTLFLDAAKGWVATALLPVFTFSHISFECHETASCNIQLGGLTISVYALVALAAVAGHCLPVWLKFKGGKGVATAFGAVLGLNPILALVCAAIWLLLAVTLRYSSFAALVAVAVAPVIACVLPQKPHEMLLYPAGIAPLALMSLLVIYRHKENIKRLLVGTEPKIGKKA